MTLHFFDRNDQNLRISFIVVQTLNKYEIMSIYFKVRVLINDVEVERAYDSLESQCFLGDFLRQYEQGKYGGHLDVQIKMSESSSFLDQDLYKAPDLPIGQIIEGFNIKSVQYEITEEQVQEDFVENNAFTRLMQQPRNLLPSRDIKLQAGPKALWNDIINWIEQHPNARFKQDEKLFMMSMMDAVYDALW